jgi:ABC-type Mn2+/Zn2+ transport system permease subunit
VFDPFQEEFMRRAIAEMTMLGAAGGALGCWVVLYRLSYAAESLSHSVLPGLVVAALAGVPLLVGGAPAMVGAALAIAVAARVPGVTREVAIGVVVTTMFGLGALLALSRDSPPGLGELLFGDILGISDTDLLAAALLLAGVGTSLLLLHGRLLAGGFDRDAARALGASPGFTEAALIVILGAAIVVAVQGLGNLLVVAVFIGPAAAARQLTDRIVPMLLLAVAIAVLAALAGLYTSYYAGTAGGASVALAIVAAYLISQPAGRLLARRRERRPGPEATIG